MSELKMATTTSKTSVISAELLPKTAKDEQTLGAVRSVDELGRILIPKTIREQKHIYPGDKFEFIMGGDIIMLARHASKCMACNDDTNVQQVHKAFLCEECREAINKTLPKSKS